MPATTMQAQTVWHVWRRIMREVPLQQALFHPPGGKLTEQALSGLGLKGEEAAAARAYAGQADRAQWFVLNYRFRLANSFTNALETGAPLVLRALLNKNADVNALGCEFLDRQGWKDFGPYVYTYCAAALDFLAAHPVSEAPKGLHDLIGLEGTVVALMRDMASQPPQTAASEQQGPLRRSPRARSYTSAHRLTAALRDKKSLGRVDLVALPADQHEHFIVYLPDPQASHKYALVPPRAAQILAALEQPCPTAELPQRLQALGFAGRTDDDTLCLTQLRAQHAIIGAEA